MLRAVCACGFVGPPLDEAKGASEASPRASGAVLKASTDHHEASPAEVTGSCEDAEMLEAMVSGIATEATDTAVTVAMCVKVEELMDDGPRARRMEWRTVV